MFCKIVWLLIQIFSLKVHLYRLYNQTQDHLYTLDKLYNEILLDILSYVFDF